MNEKINTILNTSDPTYITEGVKNTSIECRVKIFEDVDEAIFNYTVKRNDEVLEIYQNDELLVSSEIVGLSKYTNEYLEDFVSFYVENNLFEIPTSEQLESSFQKFLDSLTN